MRQLAKSAQDAQSSIRDSHENFSRSVDSQQARRAAQDVARPWLVGRSQPLARELTLPTALQANVNTTLLFAEGAMDLAARSEEHTSELQSLMRISYAVFCLKKKTKTTHNKPTKAHTTN